MGQAQRPTHQSNVKSMKMSIEPIFGGSMIRLKAKVSYNPSGLSDNFYTIVKMESLVG